MKKEQSPSEKIEAAFHKLNPEYALHPSTLNYIIFMSTSERAESFLHDDPRLQGLILSMPKYPTSLKECSVNAATKEIDDIQEAIAVLRETAYAIHGTTYKHMLDVGFEIGKFERFLHAIKIIANKTKENLQEYGKQNPTSASFRSGAPQKKIPLHIAKVLSEEYFKATGKRPTRSTNPYAGGRTYGDFFELVKTVFIALEIKAGAANMARMAIKQYDNHNPKNKSA